METETAEIEAKEKAQEEIIEEEVVESEEIVESEAAEAEPETTEEEEMIVSIGEESPPQEDKAPEWVRDLRKNHSEIKKENKQLKAELESFKVKKSVELGAKPTLEGCDYDTEEYDKKLSAWYEKKREADAQQAKVAEEQERQNKEWQATLSSYEIKKTELKAKVKDYDEAEEFIKETFSEIQQGVILQGAKNPALLILALGKNPQKAKELSSIKDPAKFIWAAAEMETQLKVTNRKAATPPEKTIAGKGGQVTSSEAALEKLRAEAAKTGDYTKVNEYKRKLKEK